MSTTAGSLPVDVDAVAAAVTACPSVARLHPGGVAGQVATYLPGRRIEGIRATDDALELHVVTRWDAPIPQAAAEVRAAVAPYAGDRPITVVVDDIDEPQAAIPAQTSPAHSGAEPVPLDAVPTPRPMGSAPQDAVAGPASPPDAVPSPS